MQRSPAGSISWCPPHAKPVPTGPSSPQQTCTIGTTDLDFGVRGVLNAAITGQSAIDVACTRGTSWSVTLDNGQSGTPASRRMTSSAGDCLSYNLFRDAGRLSLWGAPADMQATGTGTGAAKRLPVYGRVPVQSTPRPGAYTDRITATVKY